MDFRVLTEFTEFDVELDLFDLARPSFILRTDVDLAVIKVERKHEMRPDLLFQDMYENLDERQVRAFLENIDIILFLNNIDNPLNIKEGMILAYPTSIEDFKKYRFKEAPEDNKISVKERLVVPNKSTKKDKNREKFKENGFSLPPTVLDKPRPPVRIENGQFSIGGL
jgi:hypothetical protein